MTVTFTTQPKPTENQLSFKNFISKYKKEKLKLLKIVENGSLLDSKTNKEFIIRYFIYMCHRSSWHGSKHLINLKRHSCET